MFRVIAKCTAAVAALTVLTSGSIAAAPTVQRSAAVPSVTVRYADLNLNTSAGVEALYARLRAAAREVCEVGRGSGLNNVMAARTCYREVLDATVHSAGLPTLTALYRVVRTREG